MSGTRKWTAGILLAAVLGACGGARAAGSIKWKPVGDALLKITGRKPPKVWNVYQDEKKKDRVLVEMDAQYLVLDAKAKEVYEINGSEFRQHGKVFETPNPAGSQPPMASTDWDMRDIGPAERIQVRLPSDNVLLDVELPHPLTLRTPE